MFNISPIRVVRIEEKLEKIEIKIFKENSLNIQEEEEEEKIDENELDRLLFS